MSTGFTAKNPVLVLKGNEVKPPSVQEISGLGIAIDRLLLDLEAHCRWIVIGAAGIVHGSDAGHQTRTRHCHGAMQIVSEGGDTAASWKVVADERNTIE